MMKELQLLQDQLHRTYQGDAWYGPSLLEILKDVTVEKAFLMPQGMDRSIATSLLHMMAWMQFAINASSGNYKKVTKEEDWPAVSETTPVYWETLLTQYMEQHERVLAYWADFPEEKLHENLPDLPFSHYFLFHGVVQHNVYHTAQIALIKRLT